MEGPSSLQMISVFTMFDNTIKYMYIYLCILYGDKHVMDHMQTDVAKLLRY